MKTKKEKFVIFICGASGSIYGIRLLKAGATIIPPSPSFYLQPKIIEELVDTVVARVLDHLGVDNNLVKRWT